MSAPHRENRAVAFSQWLYRRLLTAYPRAHRQEYGAAMAQLFRDQCRDAWNRRQRLGLIWLWLHVLPDLVKTAVWERLTGREERKYMLRKLLGGDRSRSALLGSAMVMFVVVFMLVVFTATIVTFIMPETYASRARIKVEHDNTRIAGQTPANGVYDPYFIQTEFEVMQSERILDEVIQRLDLNTKWSAKYNSPTKLRTSESRALLRNMIELHGVRNTSLIDITAYSDDKEEAKKIANTDAEVFVDYRRDQAKQLAAARSYQNSTADIAGLSAEIIEHAETAMRPVRPNKPLNIFIGCVAGMFLGLLSATVVVVLGTVVRKPPEIARPVRP